MRIATDTGGTFTDCVFAAGGKLQVVKVPSQSKQPALAIAKALELVRSKIGAQAAKDLDLSCGTTVGTNALLERRGGRVLLITTAGFEDVLEIGRQARPKLYDLLFQKPEILVPAERRIGAHERVAADGRVVEVLTQREIQRLLRQVRKGRSDAVAVCFLFSFRNPAHERTLAKALREAGYLVSVSHEILPEFREFERSSTTVINAYLAPAMTLYLRETEACAKKAWFGKDARARGHTRVRVMQSNGGIISTERAAAEPVRTVLSGPAGGILGAAYAASLAGLNKVITFDMGGTSTDVALLSGESQVKTEAQVAGFPVAVPMLDIHTVGAGGGSLARFDAGGSLRVGPESAGADPGPICYGKGESPTVTDAHAVLGHFGDHGLLNGGLRLDVERARRIFQKHKQTFSSVQEFAQGIIGVSNSVMERALRLISIERGHDPREYTLVAFGGAGGLHACELADALELRGVLLPVFPGALSALGILRADVVRDFSRTILLQVVHPKAALASAREISRELESQAQRSLSDEGFAKSQRRVEHRLDLRYVGQAYELSVPATAGFTAAFHEAHERAYGHADRRRAIEIVNVRCRALGISAKPRPGRIAKVRSGTVPVADKRVKCFTSGRWRETPFYERERLRFGHEFSGPAIVAEYSATSLIPQGWHARVDSFGQIHLTMRKAARRNGR